MNEKENEVTDYIGTATMRDDKTIVMFLRAEDPATGIVGHAQLSYEPQDDQYNHVLTHIGGLRPGQQKPVRAFPEK